MLFDFQIDAFPVWNSWGHALIRMEHYAQARVKFKYVHVLIFEQDMIFFNIVRNSYASFGKGKYV